MKKTSNVINALLESLSVQGDSAAFFSRCEQYFSARYQKERDAGVTHQEASDLVIAEANNHFKTFIAIPQKQHAAWLEEHCTLGEANENDSVEVLLDKKIFAEKASFLKCCAYSLMTTASSLKKEDAIRKKKVSYQLLHNRFSFFITILLVLLLLVGGTLFIMFKLHIALTIMISTPENTYSFSTPIPTKNSQTTINPDHLTPQKDSTAATIADSGITKEAIAPATPVDKPEAAAPVEMVRKRTKLPPVKPKPEYIPPPAPVEPAVADPWAPSPSAPVQKTESITAPEEAPAPPASRMNTPFETTPPSESIDY